MEILSPSSVIKVPATQTRVVENNLNQRISATEPGPSVGEALGVIVVHVVKLISDLPDGQALSEIFTDLFRDSI